MTAFVSDVMTILRRELLRYGRERAFLLAQVLLPVLAVLLIGLPAGKLGQDLHYASYLGAGILMLTITSGAIGGGYTLIEDVQRGFLRSILVAPISRTSIVVGKILARLLLSLLLVITMGTVLAFFTDIGLAHPLLSLGALVAITFGFVALGILLATSLRRTESFRTVAVFVTLPLYLLSGMFFPIETFPRVTYLLALLNPLTYGVDLFRYGTIGVHELPLVADGLVLLAFAVLMTALAARAFERRLAG